MSFWKIFFGSLLAFVIGSILVVLLLVGLIAGIASSFSKQEAVKVKANSVLQLNLNYNIKDQTDFSPFENLSFGKFEPSISPGLYDILQNISKAKNDENIKGIYLTFGNIGGGSATAEEIRNALIDFKQSGKFIVAYAEVYSERAYYVCSAADKVYVNPKGAIEFNGINAQVVFLKKLLDKIGVEAQVFYDGKYKTATEPFRLDSMSEANEIMTRALITDIYDHAINGIAAAKNLNATYLDSINDNFLVRNAKDAKQYQLVDDIWFEDQVREYLKQQLKLEEKDKLELISLVKYMDVPEKDKKISASDDKIAIIYAQGEIVDGSGDDDQIGSAPYIKLLRKVRDDEKVKAVVLRVNSPGGSGLASDVINREVELLVGKKPVVVSMGDYAASGGYYISCNASKIIAQPNTLTGSIGVFGILPNIGELMNDKLGITFDNVQTGKYSDFPTVNRAVRPDEAIIIQKEIDTFYYDFKVVVATGRKLELALVDSIAQGRVWTGSQAVQNGLVDTLGGINDAIALAVKLAASEKYRIVEYPEPDKELFNVLKAFSDDKEEKVMREKLGIFYPMFLQLQYIAEMKGVQARMPMQITIE